MLVFKKQNKRVASMILLDHMMTGGRTAKILSDSARVMPRSWMLPRVVMSPQPPSGNSLKLAIASPSHLSCFADSSPLGTCSSANDEFLTADAADSSYRAAAGASQ